MDIPNSILETRPVQILIKALEVYKSQVLENKELPQLTRNNWLNFLDWEDMKGLKETFYLLKNAFAEGEDNSKTFAQKFIKIQYLKTDELE